jgi:hypothetical protein
LTYVQHVVEDIKLNDCLASNKVIHHGGIYVIHNEKTEHQNHSLQNVADLGRLQKLVSATTEE